MLEWTAAGIIFGILKFLGGSSREIRLYIVCSRRQVVRATGNRSQDNAGGQAGLWPESSLEKVVSRLKDTSVHAGKMSQSRAVNGYVC